MSWLESSHLRSIIMSSFVQSLQFQLRTKCSLKLGITVLSWLTIYAMFSITESESNAWKAASNSRGFMLDLPFCWFIFRIDERSKQNLQKKSLEFLFTSSHFWWSLNCLKICSGRNKLSNVNTASLSVVKHLTLVLVFAPPLSLTKRVSVELFSSLGLREEMQSPGNWNIKLVMSNTTSAWCLEVAKQIKLKNEWTNQRTTITHVALRLKIHKNKYLLKWQAEPLMHYSVPGRRKLFRTLRFSTSKLHPLLSCPFLCLWLMRPKVRVKNQLWWSINTTTGLTWSLALLPLDNWPGGCVMRRRSDNYSGKFLLDCAFGIFARFPIEQRICWRQTDISTKICSLKLNINYPLLY